MINYFANPFALMSLKGCMTMLTMYTHAYINSTCMQINSPLEGLPQHSPIPSASFPWQESSSPPSCLAFSSICPSFLVAAASLYHPPQPVGSVCVRCMYEVWVWAYICVHVCVNVYVFVCVFSTIMRVYVFVTGRGMGGVQMYRAWVLHSQCTTMAQTCTRL